MNKKKKRANINPNEVMLVMVNKDYERTYSASIHCVDQEGCKRRYTAKSELKTNSVLCVANTKNRLSENMDELATIIEDRITMEAPAGTKDIAGSNFFLN